MATANEHYAAAERLLADATYPPADPSDPPVIRPDMPETLVAAQAHAALALAAVHGADAPAAALVELGRVVRAGSGAAATTGRWEEDQGSAGEPAVVPGEDRIAARVQPANPARIGLALAGIASYVETQGDGSIALYTDAGAGGWSVSVEFGREAPDSPMLGGTAYSVGPLDVALTQAAHQMGLDGPESTQDGAP